MFEWNIYFNIQYDIVIFYYQPKMFQILPIFMQTILEIFFFLSISMYQCINVIENSAVINAFISVSYYKNRKIALYRQS